MFECFTLEHLKTLKNSFKEEFLQDQLYVEDQYFILNEIPQKNKNEEEVERGVYVIDLL